jgi:AraC-like DNA-binding protein
LTLPLQWFLRRPWPETFRRTILNGEPVCHCSELPYEAAQFAQWQADLASGAPEAAQCMLLETEARLRRLAAHLPGAQEAHAAEPTLTHSQAECMAAYLTDHFAETLLVETVAAAAGLHPNYAMTVFRKAYGMTIGEYLTQVRIAYAQQLLVTTDQKVLNIALQAGFGSSSQFYVAFKRLCGQSPHEFRASLR